MVANIGWTFVNMPTGCSAAHLLGSTRGISRCGQTHEICCESRGRGSLCYSFCVADSFCSKFLLKDANLQVATHPLTPGAHLFPSPLPTPYFLRAHTDVAYLYLRTPGQFNSPVPFPITGSLADLEGVSLFPFLAFSSPFPFSLLF